MADCKDTVLGSRDELMKEEQENNKKKHSKTFFVIFITFFLIGILTAIFNVPIRKFLLKQYLEKPDYWFYSYYSEETVDIIYEHHLEFDDGILTYTIEVDDYTADEPTYETTTWGIYNYYISNPKEISIQIDGKWVVLELNCSNSYFYYNGDPFQTGIDFWSAD